MSDRLEDIINFRKQKLQRFEEKGLEAYPSTVYRTHTNREVLERFSELQGQAITLVGRIRSIRAMGGLVFLHIDDGTGRIQILIKADEVGDEAFGFFVDNFDIGDFAEFSGTLFVTKTEEKTLQTTQYKLLAKSLRPLPSDYYGLEDEETRLRKRYLDILLSPEVKELFVKKARFWNSMREFLMSHGFLEMHMPVLEPVPGGAEAEPFITHHNALDRDFYLRISLELPLKKMLVAGYEKVFEIGRIFRNEGIDTTHLQDYMQMEFYWAYGDFEQMLEFLEKMYQHVIRETFGTLQVANAGKMVDWSGKWERVNYLDLFKQYTGIDLESATDDELKRYADSQNIKYEDFVRRGRLIDLIFKKIRSNLPSDRPIFLINQPLELEPLAKRVPGHPHLVQRAQIIAYGTELGKGFGELNDPIDQRARFEEQMRLREAGDKEAQMIDEDYVEAMEYGMPPAAGFGVSERLFSMLADKPIRETVLFPPMRDSNQRTENRKQKAENSDQKPENGGKIPSREEALELLHSRVHTPNLIKHMLATEAFMQGLAEKFGGDPHRWGIAGLLHDLDWDETKDNPEKHSLIAFEQLSSMGIDPEICNAIKIHNDRHGIPPVTLLDKALLLEVYTGFVTACALVQPDKKLSSVTVDSAMKKFKTKSFAAGANRQLMSRSDELVGLSVEQTLELCLKCMQGIADELGL